MSEDKDEMTEEEAIARVVLMEEEYHQESKSSFLEKVRRGCYACLAMGMLILVTLFPLILMKKDRDYPVLLIIFAAILIAGGVVGLIWERVQVSNAKKDPFEF